MSFEKETQGIKILLGNTQTSPSHKENNKLAKHFTFFLRLILIAYKALFLAKVFSS